MLILGSMACGEGAEEGEIPGSARPVAVLGDSDSHSYQDPAHASRGGEFRASTLQWTEIWARLRPHEIAPGSWGSWGTSGRIARLRRAVGLHGRAPRKTDYRFNLAVSGVGCASLNGGYAQATALLELMERDPAAWARGLVVVRIGVNDFGQPEHLDALLDPDTAPEVRAAMAGCLEEIGTAIRRIRERHAETRIVLVGIFDNTDWAKVLDRWRDPTQLAAIRRTLDDFDDGLRRLVEGDSRLAFHSDREWFAGRWGGRDASGLPAYVPATFGPVSLTNTVGDHPGNLILEDGHLGTLGNALWLNSVLTLVESRWSLGFTPVTPEEVLGLADPDGALGLRREAGPGS